MGAGAVGSYYGALLARDGHEVAMVARGAHLDALAAAGRLVVRQADGGRWDVPVTALAASNHRFRRRFAAVEDAIAESGRKLGEVSLAEMDRLWDDVKAREKA